MKQDMRLKVYPERSRKIDPVCGMDLTGDDDITAVSHKGTSFYLCGRGCEDRFKKKPDKFQGTPLITLDNVWKIFKLSKDVEVKVLRGLNLHIWEGDFVAIIGSSGSGKSTSLNMMGLLDRPTSGRISLRGEDVSKLSDDRRADLRSQTFGFVFQQYNLIPWLTAYENVTLPLIFSGRKLETKEVGKRFQEIGLTERIGHRPFELSGGEQQRAALMRSLVNDPEIILGDEPTGNLDSVTGSKILEMLIDLNKTHKKTLVIVTHDADIAERADQVITFKDGHLVRDHQAHKRAYTE
jgi:putative ABC transport system ATP-binding protein